MSITRFDVWILLEIIVGLDIYFSYDSVLNHGQGLAPAAFHFKFILVLVYSLYADPLFLILLLRTWE